jgi:serine/threonine-protein kinase HipA
MVDPVVAEVRLWNRRVGAIAEEGDGTVTFEYEPGFTRAGLEISPFTLPLSQKGPVSFPELTRIEAFQGLPGVLADALPDRFGTAVIARDFAERGTKDSAGSPVRKLLYVGSECLGALEFEPALRFPSLAADQEPLAISALVEQARTLVEGRASVAIPEILRIGAPAGGARPKAVILWNQELNEVRPAFVAPRSGDEHWIIKFDGVGELGAPDETPKPYNRIEYAYSLMARSAGLDVPQSQLLEERGYAHFLSRRFDREGERRLHLHSLGGMRHLDYNSRGQFSYEQYLRTVLALGLGYPALEEAFRRTVFNIAAVNQDDHVKNFAFLMDESGAWRLAPAYDLTYARGLGPTRAHQMSLGGKTGRFVREDLLALGKTMGLRKGGAALLEGVIAALREWERFAAEAGVHANRVRFIASEFRLV